MQVAKELLDDSGHEFILQRCLLDLYESFTIKRFVYNYEIWMDGHQKRAIDLGNLSLVFYPSAFDFLLLSFSFQPLEHPLVFGGMAAVCFTTFYTF